MVVYHYQCHLSINSLELLYSPYVAVVAIDFGTTYSGYAFSFIKDKEKDSIFMNREWVNEHGNHTSKTPTSLLLKPDQSFDSFGYKAVEKYAQLQDQSSEQRYYFFQHFKMALHNDEVCIGYQWAELCIISVVAQVTVLRMQ